ncbi:MAG: AAA family ATPase [Pirellulaceae bacterium]
MITKKRGGCQPPEPRIHADTQAEKGVLSAILNEPKQLVNVQAFGLRPEHFFDDANREIYQSIADLFGRGTSPEITALLGELNRRSVAGKKAIDYIGGAGYLAKVINIQAVACNSVEYSNTIVEHWWRREQERQTLDLLQRIEAGEPIEDVAAIVDGWAERNRESRNKRKGPKTMATIIETAGDMRKAVIAGLLRAGETMNVVAPTKRGKSWLVIGLVLQIVVGGRWLGSFQCTKGRVLVLDNELHEETAKQRYLRVSEAMGLDVSDWGGSVQMEFFRGQNMDLEKLGAYLEQFRPGEFSLIVLDALYRFLPPGVDENSNSDMTRMYNLIDSYARRLGCAIVCITHSSKGDQAGKSVTDVGSGAGSQSRAPDTHVVLRQHQEPDAVVLDLAARSWPPLENPVVLRWDWPVWFVDHSLDPAALYRPDRGRKAAEKELPWTAERFASQFITETRQPKPSILDNAVAAGLTNKMAEKLLSTAAAKKLAFRSKDPDDARLVLFSTQAA